ncbi:MAG: sigma-54 interaction domain-containing protein, partial [Allomuricauda sp.]
DSANMLESLVKSHLNGEQEGMNTYLPSEVRVIGSNETETLNEGTISTYGTEGDTFFTLILRNIDERVFAERKINSLTNQAKYLQEEIKQLTNDYGIIAKDHTMANVLDLVEQVATTEATVLIQGETGTGKELVARAIHNASDRTEKPLIRINCGAIPANLIESELFGHEKGAFTGATTSRKGRFLLADKGTIFLDEIGELPLDLQPKLLRVIQEGEFDPVGSSETIKVDVRIIAATHRDLLEFSKTGKFREDLYYRLNVFPIVVPALKDRGDDVCLIADRMVKQFSKKMNKYIEPLTDDQKKLFLEYDWPGNVRELQNLIERAIIVSNNGQVNWQNIIPHDSLDKANTESAQSNRILTSKEMVQLEKENILKALRQTNWKISGENGAAALLQLRPTTLTSKIKALGIIRPV